MKQKLQESHLDYIHKTKRFDELYEKHSRNLQVGTVIVFFQYCTTFIRTLSLACTAKITNVENKLKLSEKIKLCDDRVWQFLGYLQFVSTCE